MLRGRRGWRVTVEVTLDGDLTPAAQLLLDAPGIGIAAVIMDADELRELEVQLGRARAVLSELVVS